mgnify:FL=1
MDVPNSKKNRRGINGWSLLNKPRRAFTVMTLAFLLSGCVSTVLEVENKSIQPIPAALVSDMTKKNMSPADPILIRIFKDESELEIWKRSRTGRYELVKAYPMCRWSGKLGPKRKSGDRQAPEGFYSVNSRMLNPNSQYYLSFNLGYPNKLEAALGYTGEAIMVHGVCSSSGCFAMTDQNVAAIYAVAREALRGGQAAFQVQVFPFRMTAKNMARNRANPNFAFWTNLKQGYDIFESQKLPPKVSYCGRRYVFNATFQDGEPADPLGQCPASIDQPGAMAFSGPEIPRGPLNVETEVNTASYHAYEDGGMNEVFRRMLKTRGEKKMSKMTPLTAVPVSRPEAALADPHNPGE